MSDTIETKFTDKRTVERYIRSGQVDEKAWEKHLKSLPDLTEKAVKVESSLGDIDEDEGDDGEE
jgi:hypothetical protein